ncbi:hypothetical protein GQ457_05G017650 [Hibiscus cannabinus]
MQIATLGKARRQGGSSITFVQVYGFRVYGSVNKQWGGSNLCISGLEYRYRHGGIGTEFLSGICVPMQPYWYRYHKPLVSVPVYGGSFSACFALLGWSRGCLTDYSLAFHKSQGLKSHREMKSRREGISIFVENVSKRIHHTALKEAFEVYGEVLDVYVAYNNLKRIHRRTTFAFVRFKGMESAWRAISEGNGRVMDGNRIIIFHAKPTGGGIVGKNQVISQIMKRKLMERDTRSYKEVLLGQAKVVEEGGSQRAGKYDLHQGSTDETIVWLLENESKSKIDGCEGERIPISFSNAEMKWRGACLVGVIKAMYNTEVVQEGLRSNGLSATVCPWFGLLVVIRFKSKEEMKACWLMRDVMLKSWFDELELLEGYDGNRQVKVWVRLLDVPLQVWNKNFFIEVGQRWGSVLMVDEDTINRMKPDYYYRLKINFWLSNGVQEVDMLCSAGVRDNNKMALVAHSGSGHLDLYEVPIIPENDLDETIPWFDENSFGLNVMTQAISIESRLHEVPVDLMDAWTQRDIDPATRKSIELPGVQVNSFSQRTGQIVGSQARNSDDCAKIKETRRRKILKEKESGTTIANVTKEGPKKPGKNSLAQEGALREAELTVEVGESLGVTFKAPKTVVAKHIVELGGETE